jgi:hypothetical protein
MSTKLDLPAVLAGSVIAPTSLAYLPIADVPLVGLAGVAVGIALIALGIKGHSARRHN